MPRATRPTGSTHRHHYHPGDSGKLTDLMEELAGGRSFHRLVSGSWLSPFLVYINRLLYDSLHQKSAVYENVLHLNICDYINRHLEEDLSLDSLSSFFVCEQIPYLPHLQGQQRYPAPPVHPEKNGFTPARTPYCPTNPSSHVYLQYGFQGLPAFQGIQKKYRCFPKGTGSSTACLNSRITPYKGI